MREGSQTSTTLQQLVDIRLSLKYTRRSQLPNCVVLGTKLTRVRSIINRLLVRYHVHGKNQILRHRWEDR